MTIERRHDPASVERILDGLPEWFGLPEANRHYVEAAASMPSWCAVIDEHVVGVALVERRFDESADLHLLAVDREAHRRGVGRALVEAVSTDLARDGVKLLQVNTVGGSFEHEGYAATRAFYRACGFLPLAELHGIEWDGPTLISARILASNASG